VVAYRHEEELLARAGGDLELLYIQSVLPEKLRLSREYLARRTWRSDLAVLFRTARTLFVGPAGVTRNLTDPSVGGENSSSFPSDPRSQ
jgi:hypothetical protein